MKQFFKNLFRKKYTVTIYFKSGNVVTKKAYEFSINKSSNDITKMEYEWADGRTLFIHLDSIEMISVK